MRGTYTTQQELAFIRPFVRFLIGLLLLVGLVTLASSHFFPFFPLFWVGESFARRVGASPGDYRRPCRSGDFP